MLRTRIVEFLSTSVQVFSNDILNLLIDSSAFDILLDSMEQHPFNNVLHLKLSEIIHAALESEDEKIIAHLLYNTSMIK